MLVEFPFILLLSVVIVLGMVHLSWLAAARQIVDRSGVAAERTYRTYEGRVADPAGKARESATKQARPFSRSTASSITVQSGGRRVTTTANVPPVVPGERPRRFVSHHADFSGIDE